MEQVYQEGKTPTNRSLHILNIPRFPSPGPLQPPDTATGEAGS